MSRLSVRVLPVFVLTVGLLWSAQPSAQRVNPAYLDDAVNLIRQYSHHAGGLVDDSARGLSAARLLNDPHARNQIVRLLSRHAVAQVGSASRLRAELMRITMSGPHALRQPARQVLFQAATGLSDEIVASPPAITIRVLDELKRLQPSASVDFAGGTATLNDAILPFNRTTINVRAIVLAASAGTVVCATFDCIMSTPRSRK